MQQGSIYSNQDTTFYYDHLNMSSSYYSSLAGWPEDDIPRLNEMSETWYLCWQVAGVFIPLVNKQEHSGQKSRGPHLQVDDGPSLQSSHTLELTHTLSCCIVA